MNRLQSNEPFWILTIVSVVAIVAIFQLITDLQLPSETLIGQGSGPGLIIHQKYLRPVTPGLIIHQRYLEPADPGEQTPREESEGCGEIDPRCYGPPPLDEGDHVAADTGVVFTCPDAQQVGACAPATQDPPWIVEDYSKVGYSCDVISYTYGDKEDRTGVDKGKENNIILDQGSVKPIGEAFPVTLTKGEIKQFNWGGWQVLSAKKANFRYTTTDSGYPTSQPQTKPNEIKPLEGNDKFPLAVELFPRPSNSQLHGAVSNCIDKQSAKYHEETLPIDIQPGFFGGPTVNGAVTTSLYSVQNDKESCGRSAALMHVFIQTDTDPSTVAGSFSGSSQSEMYSCVGKDSQKRRDSTTALSELTGVISDETHWAAGKTMKTLNLKAYACEGSLVLDFSTGDDHTLSISDATVTDCLIKVLSGMETKVRGKTKEKFDSLSLCCEALP